MPYFQLELLLSLRHCCLPHTQIFSHFVSLSCPTLSNGDTSVIGKIVKLSGGLVIYNKLQNL